MLLEASFSEVRYRCVALRQEDPVSPTGTGYKTRRVQSGPSRIDVFQVCPNSPHLGSSHIFGKVRSEPVWHLNHPPHLVFDGLKPFLDTPKQINSWSDFSTAFCGCLRLLQPSEAASDSWLFSPCRGQTFGLGGATVTEVGKLVSCGR
ncbi:hypothetical protein Baya_4899 [Bagarius yarrelli]|uniref:Uncharacterized protein n=1 Tax=Bagarius yarrelli TaxID=175774 RepID=A0A556TRC0_BAGYA|nr:hypothetical protein Baya_4899 [Bagarius yarrelli]